MRRASLASLLAVACSMRAGLDPEGTVAVPGGPFQTGSDLDARARAMDRLGRAPVPEAHDALARLQAEPRAREVELDPFRIMPQPVSNADYHRFVVATGAPEPWIDPIGWAAADTGYDDAAVARHAWTNGAPTAERAARPVVLVDHPHAEAYCAWWGGEHGGRGLLPSELQWERAARDSEPREHRWGDVFEWTRTRASEGAFVVKGGSRPAARHGRPAGLRHVAIGFRCVLLHANTAK